MPRTTNAKLTTTMPKFPHRNGNSLWRLIEERMTTVQQDDLAVTLCLTERQVGQRINSPRLLTMPDIQRLAELLDTDPATLINEHGAGQGTMTIEQARAMGINITA